MTLSYVTWLIHMWHNSRVNSRFVNQNTFAVRNTICLRKILSLCSLLSVCSHYLYVPIICIFPLPVCRHYLYVPIISMFPLSLCSHYLYDIIIGTLPLSLWSHYLMSHYLYHTAFAVRKTIDLRKICMPLSLCSHYLCDPIISMIPLSVCSYYIYVPIVSILLLSLCSHYLSIPVIFMFPLSIDLRKLCVTCHTSFICDMGMTHSYIWMSHVTYEWVMSHMNETCHIWMLRVHCWSYVPLYICSHYLYVPIISMFPLSIDLQKMCVTCHNSFICDRAYIWMSHVTYEWVMSHMNETCYIWMKRVDWMQRVDCRSLLQNIVSFVRLFCKRDL